MSGHTGVGPAARELLRGCRWLVVAAAIALGAAAALVVVFDLVAQLTHNPPGRIGFSIWERAGSAGRWIMFVSGVLAVAVTVPVLVAHGVTRRACALAGALVTVLLAGVGGLFMTAGFQLERAAYTLIGGTQSLTDAHLFSDPAQAHLVLAEHSLGFAAFMASGWLVGITYYRFGGWRGTALLTLTAVLPLATAELALTSALWFYGPGLVLIGTLPALVVALVIIALTVLAMAVLTRQAPIRARRPQ